MSGWSAGAGVPDPPLPSFLARGRPLVMPDPV
jgi:hypothetical protein